MSKVLTICPFCGSGCGVFLEAEAGRISGVAPSKSHPVNQGSLAINGWNCHQFVNHDDRLRTPLVRDGADLKPASWGKAIETIVKNLKRIQTAHGAAAIGCVGSLKCTNEDNYLLMKFARRVLGTNNIDSSARFYQAPTWTTLAPRLGYGAAMNSLSEIQETDLLVVIGADPKSQMPRVGALMLRAIKNGTPLLLVDPYTSLMAPFATHQMRPRPATDLLWIHGLIKIILEQKGESTAGHNLTALTDSLATLRLEYVTEVTGIAIPDLQKAAAMITQANRVLFYYGPGLTQQAGGSAALNALLNLAILTGNIGTTGAGINPLNPANNMQGAIDMGVLPEYLPGFQSPQDVAVAEKFQKRWGQPIPSQAGLTLGEMLFSNQLKALYVMGENLALSAPNTTRTRQALEAMEFLVVQDLFLTETAQLADVVLPAASFAEKQGTFTNTERRIQLIQPVIPPVGESLPDWEIIVKLAQAFGADFNYPAPAAIMAEIADLTPSYQGVTYEKLNRLGGLQWPVLNGDIAGKSTLTPAELKSDYDTYVFTQYTPPSEFPDPSYPFNCVFGRVDLPWLTGTLVNHSFLLSKEFPEAYFEINVEDARELGIRNGQAVTITSRHGSIRRNAVLTQRILPKMVYIPVYSKNGVTHELLSTTLESQSKIPEYKTCVVKLEK
ncbi:molybdopterin-dependent oxidoreductase [candidate division KSB1 bacterium]|nr:molybdopterin-dependent oxidoreductase [candidate division KSB1 bacterium]